MSFIRMPQERGALSCKSFDDLAHQVWRIFQVPRRTRPVLGWIQDPLAAQKVEHLSTNRYHVVHVLLCAALHLCLFIRESILGLAENSKRM
jgi:hypothetical protein